MKKFGNIISVIIICALIGVIVFQAGSYSIKLEALEQRLQQSYRSYETQSEKLKALEKQLEELSPEKDSCPNPKKMLIPMELIPQNPGLPNGCEITAATMVLNYWGYEADKMEMARVYLPKGEPFYETDPEELYMGDPEKDSGWYCMTGPIVKAVNRYFEANKVEDMEATDITGVGIEEMKDYILRGYPLIIWGTVSFSGINYRYEFKLPDGSYPYTRLHCMVLTGYDEEGFYINDPLEITEKVSYEDFIPIFEGLGRRAVLIHEK